MGNNRYASSWHALLWYNQVIVFAAWSSNFVVADSRTGKYDTANKMKYVSIQNMFVGNTLKCKKLNERLCIYTIVDCLKIPILWDNNAIHAKLLWWGKDTTLYLLEHMNSFTIKQVLLLQNDTSTYDKHDTEISKWINALRTASSTDEINIQVNEKLDLPANYWGRWNCTPQDYAWRDVLHVWVSFKSPTYLD